MEISSTAFKDGERIPVQYVMPGAGGKNVSLPFAWKNAPAGTRSFALSMIDPHPVAKNWIHWLVVNIPPRTAALDEGASGKKMPAGSIELRNSFGKTGYGGPQPPRGSGDHPYVITIYALNVDKLDVGANASSQDFKNALEGRILGSATITGKFGT